MEWAQAHEIGAALLELHITSDNVDDIDAVEQIGNE